VPVAQSTRWKFHDPALLWLFPATYVVHVVEETLASAPVLLWNVRLDRPFNLAAFTAANAAGILLTAAGVRLVGRGPAFHWIVPALVTAVVLNTAGHFVGSIAARRYSAGLLSAAVLWVPVALLTIMRVWDQSTTRNLVAGTVVGVAIELVVISVMVSIGATTGW
jgi:hypothetical protein